VTRSQNLFHAANNGLKPVGAKSHLAKLTEDDVREIRRRQAAGELQRIIAADFGVSATCISKITTNKKWKQLAA
jgi:DNA invertase Pin-like site-specific DNA recombinase